MKLPGQPAVAGPLTGILEMVVPSKTGFLAARLSPESLAETLVSALADPEQQREMRDRVQETRRGNLEPGKVDEAIYRVGSLTDGREPITGGYQWSVGGRRWSMG